MKFTGSFPALVTPFQGNNIDFKILSQLASTIAAHSAGLTLLGTTAESWLLTLEEKIQILETCRQVTDKPLIVGINAWNIEDFNEQQEAFKQFNPAAYLLAAPPYLQLSTQQAKAFFLGCTVRTKTPLILYHNPKRNGVVFDENIYNLAQLYPEIIGFKETSWETYEKFSPQYPTLTWIAGDDLLIKKMNAKTSINVGGNLYPEAFSALCAGQQQSLDLELWSEVISQAVNPMTIKYLLFKEGALPTAACRPPLNHLKPEQKKAIDQTFALWKEKSSALLKAINA